MTKKPLKLVKSNICKLCQGIGVPDGCPSCRKVL